jgi:hypothetical protein
LCSLSRISQLLKLSSPIFKTGEDLQLKLRNDIFVSSSPEMTLVYYLCWFEGPVVYSLEMLEISGNGKKDKRNIFVTHYT